MTTNSLNMVKKMASEKRQKPRNQYNLYTEPAEPRISDFQTERSRRLELIMCWPLVALKKEKVVIGSLVQFDGAVDCVTTELTSSLWS